MRKLSEIKGPEAMVVIGGILPIIVRMVQKSGKPGDGNALNFFANMIASNPDDAIELVAIIDGKPKEDYMGKNIIEISSEVLSMAQDEELMKLFASQTMNQTSSSSATMISEVKE